MTDLLEMLLIEPQVFVNPRGKFPTVSVREAYTELGIVGNFVPNKYTQPNRGTLRGFHFQKNEFERETLNRFGQTALRRCDYHSDRRPPM